MGGNGGGCAAISEWTRADATGEWSNEEAGWNCEGEEATGVCGDDVSLGISKTKCAGRGETTGDGLGGYVQQQLSAGNAGSGGGSSGGGGISGNASSGPALLWAAFVRSRISGYGESVSGKNFGCAAGADREGNSSSCSGAELLQRVSRRDAESFPETGRCEEVGRVYATACSNFFGTKVGANGNRAGALPSQGGHADAARQIVAG